LRSPSKYDAANLSWTCGEKFIIAFPDIFKRSSFMPKLVIHAGTPQAREFELKPGSNYVGRGDDNDFIIPDPSVSANHARIIVSGGTASIKDLGSTNGTYVNDARVAEVVLQPGHALRLGGVEIFFERETPATSPIVLAPSPGSIRPASPTPPPPG
jgi:predicted component of type VI protein secretion system